MSQTCPRSEDRTTPAPLLGLIAVAMLVPVTLPVPVLRGLVYERFGVSEFWTHLFMSVNMIGAVLAAPLAGMIADRIGRHRVGVVVALVVDAACFLAMTADVPFAVFMALRFLEGCAHITALSLLLAIAADLSRRGARGRSMGFVGGGLTMGVAIGAPIGGWVGREDPLQALRVAAWINLALAMVCGIWLTDIVGGRARPTARQIIRLARRELSLLVPLAYAFVDRFTVGFFTTTFTLWMRRVNEMESAEIGLLLGLFMAPFSLLSYPFARLAERYSHTRLIAGGSLIYGLGLCTLGLWQPGSLYFVLPMLGVFSAVMFVPSLLLATDLSSPEIRSTVFGAFNAAGSLGFIAGPIVGGLVSQSVADLYDDWQLGYSAAFVVAGLAEVACVLLTLSAMRRLRDSGRTT